MTIWILAILLLAICASAGYSQGAIRVSFSLVGIFVGLWLALPLAPLVIGLLPFVGITTGWVQQIVGPIVAFYLVGAAFKATAAVVHRKADYHYKYRVADAHRALWERMNRRVGLCLGLVNGMLYFLLVCLVISVLGYFVLQVKASESESGKLRFFSRLAQDLVATRMDKVVGGLNPAPKAYFDFSDFVGFVVQNRQVIRRFETYPPVVVMARKPNWQGILGDKDLFRSLETERDPAALLNHPRVQQVLTNADLRAELQSLDLVDLEAYLRTGRSPKYEHERILGRWQYDFPSTFKAAKQQRPQAPASEMIRLRRDLEGRYAGAALSASLDNRIALQLPANIEGTPVPGLTNAPPRTSYTGTWKNTGSGSYELTLAAKGGRNFTTRAQIEKRSRTERGGDDAERIRFEIDDKPLVFVKVPE